MIYSHKSEIIENAIVFTLKYGVLEPMKALKARLREDTLQLPPADMMCNLVFMYDGPRENEKVHHIDFLIPNDDDILDAVAADFPFIRTVNFFKSFDLNRKIHWQKIEREESRQKAEERRIASEKESQRLRLLREYQQSDVYLTLRQEDFGPELAFIATREAIAEKEIMRQRINDFNKSAQWQPDLTTVHQAYWTDMKKAREKMNLFLQEMKAMPNLSRYDIATKGLFGQVLRAAAERPECIMTHQFFDFYRGQMNHRHDFADMIIACDNALKNIKKNAAELDKRLEGTLAERERKAAAEAEWKAGQLQRMIDFMQGKH